MRKPVSASSFLSTNVPEKIPRRLLNRQRDGAGAGSPSTWLRAGAADRCPLCEVAEGQQCGRQRVRFDKISVIRIDHVIRYVNRGRGK